MANKNLGLTDAQVLESRRKHGANVLTPPVKEAVWRRFLGKFGDSLIIILIVACLLSTGIACYEFFRLGQSAEVFFEPCGIFAAIVLATGLAFYFEYRADKEFALLNRVNDDEPVEVVRNGNVVMIPRRCVVVGDVAILDTGDEVAADGVLVEAVQLRVDESSLTGEPVCNKSVCRDDFDTDAAYPSDHVLKGTRVVEGHGVFRVVAVGDSTEQGRVFEAARIDRSVKTPLNEQLDTLAAVIAKFGYAFAALIVVGRLVVFFEWSPVAWSLAIPTAIFFWAVVGRFGKWSRKAVAAAIAGYFVVLVGMTLYLHNLLMPDTAMATIMAYTLNTLMLAVTLIVVSVPEGLPMAVTLALAYSMRRMLKTNNLVRRMHACETMGATTVICTDKTGTLTQNRMKVAKMKICTDGVSDGIIDEGLAVNSTACIDFSDADNPHPLGNPTEGALLLWLADKGVDYRKLREEAKVVEELPFSTERKYMATVVESAVAVGRRVLYVKGAPEIVLSFCTLSAADREAVGKQLGAYQKRAMRTLGFAYRILDDGERGVADGELAVSSLRFVGMAAIADPVRRDVPMAVRECLEAGIAVKMVTGDTPETAKEIGRQAGLWTEDDTERNIVTGREFAVLSDAELLERVSSLKIIARARPMDKKRMVEALQRAGHVVAVTGDGTNDAPALKAAHVGLSMGDGTSVAKEASDITIMDNSFSSIVNAVIWGRSLYKNIQRFLLFQLTVNVTACFTVLCGAFMGTESPLTVTQMLWINLIMDTCAAMALASLPPSRDVMKERPRNRNAFILTRSMTANIVGVGIIFFAVLITLLYIFRHADICRLTDLLSLQLGAKGAVTTYESTLLFTVFVMTHFFYLFNARAFETGRSALRFKGCSGLLTIAAIIFAGQIAIVELPVLQRLFNVCGLKAEDWLIIVVCSSAVLWIREGWCFVAARVARWLPFEKFSTFFGCFFGR
ncbi:MAG: cation-translocating P-type ATPase [Alistipes sp.]